MSEREDVAAKRARGMAQQSAFKEALGALESLPQQLVTLTSRASQPLPPDLAWSQAKRAGALPGKLACLLDHTHLFQPTQGWCDAQSTHKVLIWSLVKPLTKCSHHSISMFLVNSVYVVHAIVLGSSIRC